MVGDERRLVGSCIADHSRRVGSGGGGGGCSCHRRWKRNRKIQRAIIHGFVEGFKSMTPAWRLALAGHGGALQT